MNDEELLRELKIIVQNYELLQGLKRIVNNEKWITVKPHGANNPDYRRVKIEKNETVKSAIERTFKQNTSKQKDKTNSEKETIAGVKKGKPMSFKKANGGRVNPNFTGAKDGYSYNCQTCVAAFEARLRGYDIEAVPYDEGNKEMKALAGNPALAYINSETGKSPEYKYSKARNAKTCEDWLKENIKRNQRYIFAFQPHYGMGHVIHVNKRLDGSLFFYDPQNGQSYGEDYLKTSVRYQLNFRNVIIGESPKIARVDDTDLNIEMLEKIFKQNHK